MVLDAITKELERKVSALWNSAQDALLVCALAAELFWAGEVRSEQSSEKFSEPLLKTFWRIFLAFRTMNMFVLTHLLNFFSILIALKVKVLAAQLFPTLCNTVDCSQPGSPVGFSRWEYWSGWPFPSPGHLPDPWIEPRSPALQAHSVPSELPGEPNWGIIIGTCDLSVHAMPGMSLWAMVLSRDHSLHSVWLYIAFLTWNILEMQARLVGTMWVRGKQEGSGQGYKRAREHPCVVRTIHCLHCEGRYVKTHMWDKTV